MAMKYCGNCGHGNQSMSQGVAVKFCCRCGSPLDSLAAFGSKKKVERSAPPTRRKRFLREEEELEDDEDEFEDQDGVDEDEIQAALKDSVSIDVSDMPKPMKAGDIVGLGGTGFTRPKGRGGYDYWKFREENQTKKGNPDIIGGNG